MENCRILISEINNNHEARTADGLDRNYHLIQELNSNLSKVRPALHGLCGAVGCPLSQPCLLLTSEPAVQQIVELYKELSSSFLTMMEEESGKPDLA